MKKAPDGRYIFIWRGKDREQDVAALAEAIAGIGELFNNEGTLVRLDGGGKILNVNLADLQSFIGERIAGVRLVPNGTGFVREYYSYTFTPLPKGPPKWEDRHKSTELIEPDDKVLRQILIDELLWRVPRVQS